MCIFFCILFIVFFKCCSTNECVIKGALMRFCEEDVCTADFRDDVIIFIFILLFFFFFEFEMEGLIVFESSKTDRPSYEKVGVFVILLARKELIFHFRGSEMLFDQNYMIIIDNYYSLLSFSFISIYF